MRIAISTLTLTAIALHTAHVRGEKALVVGQKSQAQTQTESDRIRGLKDRRYTVESSLSGAEDIYSDVDSFTDGGGTVEVFRVNGRVVKGILRLGLSSSYEMTECFFDDSGAPFVIEVRRRYFKMDAKGNLVTDVSPIAEEGTTLFLVAGNLVGVTDPGGLDLRLIKPNELIGLARFIADAKNVKARWKGLAKVLGTSS